MAKSLASQVFSFQKRCHYPGHLLLRRKISQFASLTQEVQEVVKPAEDPVPLKNTEAGPIENEINSDILRQSLNHPDYFGLAELFTVEDLFNANVHLGHRNGSLCSYMKPYLLGSRLGHLVFDLDQTCELLRDALNFTAHVAFRGGIILFIGRTPQHQELIEQSAEDCQEFSHTKQWDLRTLKATSDLMGAGARLPDTLLFFNTMDTVLEGHRAVMTAAKLLIPSVGIVDSNCDPRLMTYPVPGNDDSHAAIRLYCYLFVQAILRGKQKRKELLKDT